MIYGAMDFMVVRKLLLLLIVILFPAISTAEIFFQDDCDCVPSSPGCPLVLDVDWHNSHAIGATICGNDFEIDTVRKLSGVGSYHFTNGAYERYAGALYPINCDWASDAEFILYNKNIYNGGITQNQHFQYNQVYWIGFWVFLDNNIEAGDYVFNDAGPEWGVIFQIHHSREACDTGSGFNNAPIALYVNGNLTQDWEGLTLYLAGESTACKVGNPEDSRRYSYTDTDAEVIAPSMLGPTGFTKNTAHRIVISFRPAYDPAENPFFRMWIDDVLTIDDRRINCFNDPVGLYMNIGIYSHANEDWDAWYDDIKVGGPNSSYAEVNPTGGSTNQPPSVSITIDGGTTTVTDTAGNPHNFQSTATDDVSVSSVYWHMDGCYADQTVEDPGSLTLSTVASCDVYATATDNQGATTNSNHISVIIGAPSITGLVNEWEFETGAITTDSQGNTALTNNGGIAVDAGTEEPDPPGNGSYGAVFNGTNQWFSVASASYHASAPFQTGQPIGSEIIFFKTPAAYPTESMFLGNMWDQTNNKRNRGVNLSASTMIPNILVGVNGGASTEVFTFTGLSSLSLSTVYKLAYSINSTTGAVNGRLYQGGSVVATASGTISGTMNLSNLPDLAIGRRADGAYRYFNSSIFYYALYNTILSSADMDTLCGLQPSTGDSSVTVDTGGGTPQIVLETGANDLVCSYVSGTGTDTLLFQGTVSAASSHISLTPVQVNSATIDENGGSIGGTGTPILVYAPHTGQTLGDGATVSIYVEFGGTGAVTLTMPTEGTSGSLSYQSPFYIDATQTYSISDYYPCNCTTKVELTGDLFYHTGQQRCQCVEFTGGTPHFSGSSSKMAIREQRDAGGPVYLSYEDGDNTNVWVFSHRVGITEVESTNVVMTDTSEFLLDRYASGTPAEVLSSADESVATTLPRTSASNTGNIIILGTPHIWFAPTE